MSSEDRVLHVSSLLASRLCHDLVSPVGALNTALELLDDADAEMREEALKLIRDSSGRSIAILKLMRMALGSSGAFEGTLDMHEGKQAAAEYYDYSKADLVWDMAEGNLPKWLGRASLCVLIALERSVPKKDSEVRIASGGGITITARGERVRCSDKLLAAFRGEGNDLEAKEMPAYLAALLAQSGGQAISVDYVPDDTVVVTIA